MSENDAAGMSFMLSLIIFLVPYFILCLEFPRLGLYKSDPWWLYILKVWGGVFVLIIGESVIQWVLT